MEVKKLRPFLLVLPISVALVLLVAWLHLTSFSIYHNQLHHEYSEIIIPEHSLDPLTIHEFNKNRTILSNHPFFKSPFSYTIKYVVLEEPEKQLVLKWKKGDPPLPRKASMVVVDDDIFRELIVDPKTDLPKHDINLANLMCLPIFSSWFGTPVEENKRLIKVKCYSKEGIVNFYMKPVEGFSALVDMHKKEVLVVSNNGQNIPVAKGINNTSTTKYHCSIQKLNRELRMLNPISLEQPKGPSFIIDGHLVKWAN
ncbi:hypothetical protein JHK85_007150 [Glycine max]|nr:hypothetical protein JHK87_006793 [Glycine soja]KAG5054640.1 hypothetical protein JHK85_007150 [Glycine max]KAG5071746.1 hypothetical protein JHK86_006957 [Glycine max]